MIEYIFLIKSLFLYELLEYCKCIHKEQPYNTLVCKFIKVLSIKRFDLK